MLYVSVTNNLRRHLQGYKQKLVAGFTASYNVNPHAEHHMDENAAITREKQVKRWSRLRKAALIGAADVDSKDLGAAWE